MNKKTILTALVILVAILMIGAGGYWYITKPLFSEKDKLTAEILTTHQWAVEANGMYDFIVFNGASNFTVYAYPDKVGAGTWVFGDGKLTLDFAGNVENRIYTDLKFDKQGALNSLTDGNKERWTISKSKI